MFARTPSPAACATVNLMTAFLSCPRHASGDTTRPALARQRCHLLDIRLRDIRRKPLQATASLQTIPVKIAVAEIRIEPVLLSRLGEVGGVGLRADLARAGSYRLPVNGVSRPAGLSRATLADLSLTVIFLDANRRGGAARSGRTRITASRPGRNSELVPCERNPARLPACQPSRLAVAGVAACASDRPARRRHHR